MNLPIVEEAVGIQFDESGRLLDCANQENNPRASMNVTSPPKAIRSSSYLPAKLAIFFSVFSMHLMISQGAVQGDFEYDANTNLNRVTIKRYVGGGGDVVIPESLGGRPVRSIGQNTFTGLTNVFRITVPAGVSGIGLGAFSGCTSLIAIDVDASSPFFSSLDGVLFDKAQSLLFAFPAGKSGAYVIPNSVARLMYKAFSGCGGLTSVTLGNGLHTLEELAFEGCSNLTQISIARGVTSIGRSSFLACNSLSAIEVDPMNLAYRSVEGVLLDRDRAELLLFPPGKAGDYEVPNGVTNIGAYSFFGCAKLTGISISNEVASVSDFAFSGCVSLTNVSIAIGVRSIGAGAFSACSSLAEFELPNGVAAIEKSTFQGCSGLTSITIPSSVTRIGNSAFWGCSSLKNLTIPDGVTSIEGATFIECSSLLSVVIPDNVTVIENSAFSGCAGLTNVTIPTGVTTIGTAAFTYCSSLKSVSVPDSVTSIGDFGFGYCTGLKDVRLPSAILTIPDNAFYACSALTNITIPSTVTSIGNSAFSGCTGLTGITIPANVTSIEDRAFQGCNALAGLYFKGSPPQISGDPFSSWPSPTFVTVFYNQGTTGWGTTFGGRPTAVWEPRPEYAGWAVSIGLVSQFPSDSGESDDPDGDGVNNHSEWYSGTDPTQTDSRLKLELTANPTLLDPTDQTPIETSQHAVYFQSVPGRYYGLQRALVLEGNYELVAVRIAGRNQTRFVVPATNPLMFYRVVVLP